MTKCYTLYVEGRVHLSETDSYGADARLRINLQWKDEYVKTPGWYLHVVSDWTPQREDFFDDITTVEALEILTYRVDRYIKELRADPRFHRVEFN